MFRQVGAKIAIVVSLLSNVPNFSMSHPSVFLIPSSYHIPFLLVQQFTFSHDVGNNLVCLVTRTTLCGCILPCAGAQQQQWSCLSAPLSTKAGRWSQIVWQGSRLSCCFCTHGGRNGNLRSTTAHPRVSSLYIQCNAVNDKRYPSAPQCTCIPGTRRILRVKYVFQVADIIETLQRPSDYQ